MLELGDDLRQQIGAGERGGHDCHRTRAAFAELGGAEAGLHQEGLGPQHVVREEVTGTRERTPPRPLYEFEPSARSNSAMCLRSPAG